jgi:acid stress-induced BolA-like protein IbaG/YrbA
MQKVSKSKLQGILVRDLHLDDAEFHLESSGGRLNGSIVSETFKGKRDSERQKMIWDALDRALGPESVRAVGMLLAYTPEEWEPDLSDAALMGHGTHPRG